MKKAFCFLLTLLIGMLCIVACSKGGENSTDSVQKTISFVNSELTMNVGEKVQADVITSQKNVLVFWDVRDKSVATISTTGLITAVGPGETICYATYGKMTAVCVITVIEVETNPVLSIQIPHDELNLYVGDDFNLGLKVLLGDEVLSNATISYDIDNKTCISCENGIVKAKAEGSAVITITATYEGNSATQVVEVTVLQAD